ncbi:MAG: hypothetical protein FWE53_04120 [Firmicutes bacterium]|nr:hypothetical protein [Bacillota bacterium]
MENQRTKIDVMIEQALGQLRGMLDTETVIGKPVMTSDGSQVFPIIKVSVGFVAGGGEYGCGKNILPKNNEYPFAGGTGAGFSAEPLGFLIAGGGKHEVVGLAGSSAFDKLFGAAGEFIRDFMSEKKHGENRDEN